jgi:hypothetical protein
MVVRVSPCANSRAVSSSANRPSWSTGTGPWITTSVTRSRHAARRITGSSAPSGSVVTPSTAARTSWLACPMSQPGAKSTRIVTDPSRAVATVASTPSTARSAGSSAAVIAASTSSAPAPGQPTCTVIADTTTSGKNWLRICVAAASPSAIITTSTRFAAVRCRVK